MALDNKQMKNALEFIFTQMEKKGLVTEGMAEKKDDLLTSVMEALGDEHELDRDDLNNMNVQKKLIGMIVSKALGEEQNCQKFLNELKPENKEDELEPKLDKTLKLSLVLVKAVKEIILKKELDKDAKPVTPAELAKSLMNKFKEELGKDNLDELEKQKKDLMKEQEDQLSQNLRSLFGGDDPRIAGEIPSTIMGPIMGNLFANVNQTVPTYSSVSFMNKAGRYDSGPDYVGTEMTSLLDDIADGIYQAYSSTPKPEPNK